MAHALTRSAEVSAREAAAAAPHMQTITLAVEGMHCGGCMRKVETASIAVSDPRTGG